jgi:hypothetical protein
MITAAAMLLMAATLIAATTPGSGTPIRKAILEALRPAIEAKLGVNIEFVVTSMKVGDGWAFVQVEPQRRGGRPINGRAYFPADWENMDGLTTTAILKYQNGRWYAIEQAIGATDAWYCAHQPVQRLLGC